MKNTQKLKQKLTNLPTKPGIYYFHNSIGMIIYVGKAASLKNRVKSYFIGAHDNKTTQLISQISNIKYQITDSVIEALILESNEIKRLMPKYNIQAKDDKSFVYIFLTREVFPRFFVDRITNFTPPRCNDQGVNNLGVKFGPFTEGGSAQKALQILRRIFGFRDCNTRKFNLYKKRNQSCLFGAIKLCPAPCVENISKDDYKKIVREITLFLAGKKKTLIIRLKKQMDLASRHQEFELASKIRNKLFALSHIQDVALIKEERPLEQLRSIPHRIEAYDISNLSGQFATGSMVVFTDGVMDKKEYRKFRIKNKEFRIKNKVLSKIYNQKSKIHNTKYLILNTKSNDPAMLAQIISRRLNHPEWPMPDLILLDGGKPQLSSVSKIINKIKLLPKKLLSQENGKCLQMNNIKNVYKKTPRHKNVYSIPIIALAKGPTRKGFRLYKNSAAKKIMLDRKLLEHFRDEAHRFAISYHRKLRSIDYPKN